MRRVELARALKASRDCATAIRDEGRAMAATEPLTAAALQRLADALDGFLTAWALQLGIDLGRVVGILQPLTSQVSNV